jgi:hypothetical protein
MVVVPLFPIMVEWIKTGDVKPETFLLTAAVLAAGYGFSTQAPLSWGLYALIFLFSVAIDYNPSGVLVPAGLAVGISDRVRWIFDHPASSLLLFAAGYHSLERFWWHVVWRRPFPDWRQEG